MSDLLLESKTARSIIKSLGLPVPVPPVLRRARGPWIARPLEDRTVVVGAATGSELVGVLADTLARAGAAVQWLDDDLRPRFVEAGEAWGRPVGRSDESTQAHALVFDATGCEHPGDLHQLHAFFAPVLRRLRASGRIVVLGRPRLAGAEPARAATQSALEGFVRSLGKEVGKRGATANLVCVHPEAPTRVEPVLRFLLSDHAAFVSGQPLTIAPVHGGPVEPATCPVTRVLEHKVALVTGAARGIGEATAMRLAEEGAHVVCLDRPQDDALVGRVAQRIGGSVLLVDIAEADAPRRIADALGEDERGVDIVVHNAGITRDKTLAKMSPEQWEQTLTINLDAIVRITEALLAGPMRDLGRLLCLSSVAGIAGNVGQTNYAASKAGVIGYVRALAPVTAARGITVNAVAPGFIETRMTAAIPVMVREAGRRLSSLGQGGRPRDVAEALTFLASPGAAGLTGQVLRVCGGAFIGA